MTIIEKDVFGIQELYATSAYGFNNRRRNGNGWEYFSDYWNKKKLYEFVPNDWVIPEQNQDLYMHFKKVPNAFVRVNGDGSITVESDERENFFQMSVYDDNNLYYGTKNALTNGKRWSSNVELTMYFSLKAYPLSFGIKGGIKIGLTSDHHFLDFQYNANQGMTGLCPFNSHEYFLMLQYDGHAYLGGEPYHPAQRSMKPDGVYDIDFWDNQFNGIPLNNMMGIKFVKKVVGTRDVYLEVWRDSTNGFEGGVWRKIFEFRHTRGNWYNASMDTPYAASISSEEYSIVPVPVNVDEPHSDGGGGMCYIRIDPIHEIDFKWISIRDIEPDRLPPTPATSDSELSTDSEYYDDDETDIL